MVVSAGLLCIVQPSTTMEERPMRRRISLYQPTNKAKMLSRIAEIARITVNPVQYISSTVQYMTMQLYRTTDIPEVTVDLERLKERSVCETRAALTRAT
jgi:hypothetical protein